MPGFSLNHFDRALRDRYARADRRRREIMADANADEGIGARPPTEYLAPITPARAAVSIPQGIRHGTTELAKASRLDGYSNANRPRKVIEDDD